MSDAKADKSSARTKLLRSILGTLAGTSYVAGQASGYDYGTDTTLGIDAGLLRDLITTGLAMLATFWPQVSKLSVIWKSLSNDPKVKAIGDDVARLESRIGALESRVLPVGPQKPAP